MVQPTQRMYVNVRFFCGFISLHHAAHTTSVTYMLVNCTNEDVRWYELWTHLISPTKSYYKLTLCNNFASQNFSLCMQITKILRFCVFIELSSDSTRWTHFDNNFPSSLHAYWVRHYSRRARISASYLFAVHDFIRIFSLCVAVQQLSNPQNRNIHSWIDSTWWWWWWWMRLKANCWLCEVI